MHFHLINDFNKLIRTTSLFHLEVAHNKTCAIFFQVQNIKFNSEIADVSANRRLVVMAFKEKLAAFDSCNLEARFTVSTWFPSNKPLFPSSLIQINE